MAKTEPRPQPINREPSEGSPSLPRRLRWAQPSSVNAIDTVVPARNFTMTADDRVRAYTQGVPSYIRRRRRIEDLETQLIAGLAAAEDPTQAVTSRRMTADLATLNDLIQRHNRYYPIEARLPIEVRTGRLLDRGVPWRPLPPVTAADLLARLRS